MKNIFALTLCIFLAAAANAQNPGYFNRKNVLEFSMNGQMPVFNNLRYAFGDPFYKVKNGRLTNSRDRFDYGFRFAYMRTVKRNFGIGLEFGYDYFSIQRDNKYVSDWFYNNNYDFEKIDVSSMMIMPKLEFSNKGSVLPMGIAHQIGIGIRMVKPRDKEYHYADGEYSGSSQTGVAIPMPDTSSYQGGSVRGLTVMYAVNMRTPLSKRLFLNYGLRYTLNFMSKPSYLEYDNMNQSIEMSEAEFRMLARQRKQYSFIQASIGLSFAF